VDGVSVQFSTDTPARIQVSQQPAMSAIDKLSNFDLDEMIAELERVKAERQAQLNKQQQEEKQSGTMSHLFFFFFFFLSGPPKKVFLLPRGRGPLGVITLGAFFSERKFVLRCKTYSY
jgi:hypothetical protein